MCDISAASCLRREHGSILISMFMTKAACCRNKQTNLIFVDLNFVDWSGFDVESFPRKSRSRGGIIAKIYTSNIT